MYSKYSAAELAWKDKKYSSPFFLCSDSEIAAQKYTLKETKILVSTVKHVSKTPGYENLHTVKDVLVFFFFSVLVRNLKELQWLIRFSVLFLYMVLKHI